MKKYLTIIVLVIIAGVGIIGIKFLPSADLGGNFLRAEKTLSQTKEATDSSIRNSRMETVQQENIGIVSRIKSKMRSVIESTKNTILPETSSLPEITPTKEPSFEGVLSVSHFDDFTNHTETPIVQLIAKDGTRTLLAINDTATEVYNTLNGATVRINGNLSGKSLVPTKIPTVLKPAPTLTATSERSGGARKLSVVLYKFANTTAPEPFTEEDVRKNFFEVNPDTGITMSDFLSQSTYGKLTLTGKTSLNGSTDVYGWYTVPTSRVNCADSGKYQIAGNEAIRMARQDGLQLDPDDYVAVGTFPDGCPTGGSVGTLLTTGQDVYPPLHPNNTPLTRIVYMNNMVNWGNTLHEFGHLSSVNPFTIGSNVAVQHSNSIKCIDSNQQAIAFTSLMPSFCPEVEYGSPLSILGGYISGAPRPRLLDGKNRYTAGYLTTANEITATQSGLYQLTKINQPSATLLKIPVDVSLALNNKSATPSVAYITAEARDFAPFEQAADTYPHANMIALRIDRGVINAGSSSVMLKPGESFSLTDSGIILTNNGQSQLDPNKVWVRVQYTKQYPPRVVEKFVVAPSSTLLTNTTNPVFPDIILTKPKSAFLARNYQEVFFTRKYPAPINPYSTMEIYNSFVNPSNSQRLVLPLTDEIKDNIRQTLSQTPRAIFQVTTVINSILLNRQVVYSTDLIYGNFSPLELTNLGVIQEATTQGNIGIIKAHTTPNTGVTGASIDILQPTSH